MIVYLACLGSPLDGAGRLTREASCPTLPISTFLSFVDSALLTVIVLTYMHTYLLHSFCGS